MRKREVRKKESNFFVVLLKLLWQIIKIPYFIVFGVIWIFKMIKRENKTIEVEKKREAMISRYEKFKILKKISGDFNNWENKISKSDSSVGIIVGARGSGKTGFGIKLFENLNSKTKKKFYAMGFNKNEMPSWIKVVENVGEIGNDSFVLIDEGGVLFSSRRAMSSPNKLLSDLILVARHKNISIVFISQNSSNLDVNIIRQADYIVLRKSSLLQKDFERKKIKEIYESVQKDFEKFKEDKGVTYIYSDEFRGFVSNPLPSFWSEGVSKGFK